MSRSSGIIIGLLLLAVSCVIVGAGYRYLRFVKTSVTPPGSGMAVKTIFYEVKKNVTLKQIASDLAKEGVISDSRLFYIFGRLSRNSAKIKVGDYRISSLMRPDEIMTVLMSGISYGLPFIVPEGYNIEQIGDVLDQIRPGGGERFILLCKNKKFIKSLGLDPPSGTLEGYLFPDTYQVPRKMSEEDIIRQMVSKYRTVFTQEYIEKAQLMGFSEYQILTLASIIEKETGATAERPLISSVFHNRLNKKMKLQTDPTVIYGRADYTGNIRKSDLLFRTPYNTYVIYGLPLGPISNPGREAIHAALFPATSEFLYFVSHNDGTHEFTSTYSDHMKAVAKYQLDRKARAGKSWRNLKSTH